ncbi:hypothetical protein Fot_14291 [Forsythia ovata]|uniref:Uncharacterized protein n=1 Tax=Forsythia ovata TaxID=205694 RepID=A0ABD1W8H4_9LAMI
MNFLMLRSNNPTAAQEQQFVQESQVESMLKPANTLGGLITEDTFPDSTPSETRNGGSDEYEGENGSLPGSNGKIAVVMNRTGVGQNTKKQNGQPENETNPVSQIVDMGTDEHDNQNGENMINRKIDSQKDVSTGESILRMEDHKRHTESLLQRLKNSHFFARIVESDEQFWSKRRASVASIKSFEMFEKKLTEDSLEIVKTVEKKNPLSVAIDRGKFDARTSGGVTRDAAKCMPLESERFSVQCGLEGIFTPGRWRRKIEIIEPIEICSFSADCNTDDLLCLQIKATSFWKCPKGHGDKHLQPSHLSVRSAASSLHYSSSIEGQQSGSPADHYAVLVSCRCNYAGIEP